MTRPAVAEPPVRRKRAAQFLEHGGIIVALLIATVVAASLAEPRFLNRLNILNVLRNFAYLAIPALGQMIVMTVGGFDLSVGGAMVVASVLAASVMSAAGDSLASMALAVAAALVSGVVIGLANGVLIVWYAISPFMVTLASLSIISGAVLYVTQGIPIYGVADDFVSVIGRGQLAGVPIVTLIALALVALVAAMQRLTAFGRHVYAVGSNPQSARLSGVKIGRTVLAAYCASGVLAALTGILVTARIGSGQSTIGGTLGLETIAAAVIGGAALSGGSGRAERVAAAALFLAIVANAMNLVQIDSKFQTLVLGCVLIFALAVERLIMGRRAVA